MTIRAKIAMDAGLGGILTPEESRKVVLEELGIVGEEQDSAYECCGTTEDSAVSVRSLFGEDVELVEFSQADGWDDAAVLRKIAEYVEESGRTPYQITYTNDEGAQYFIAYLHA